MNSNSHSALSRIALWVLGISSAALNVSLVHAEERQGLLLNAGITAEYDDNVLRKNNAVSDNSLSIAPKAQYLTNFGKHLFYAKYKGDYAAYNHNSDLNHDDHDLGLFARFDHNLKINTEFGFSYKDKIEQPGTNNSSTEFFNQFNDTTKANAKAKFFYGSNSSIGQLVFGLDYGQNRYTNNLQSYRDVDKASFSTTFYYRIAPKTRLLFQASANQYSYVERTQFPKQSSVDTFLLAGIEWDITAKTSGTFKVGYQGKDYDEAVYNDFSGLSYMLDMTWKPNTYSKIKIAASRMTRESSQLFTSAFVSNSYSINAEHKITPRTQLKAKYALDSDDIFGARDRTDKRHELVFGVDHSLLTWLNISMDYRHTQRTSDLALYEYKANIIGLSLTTKFD